LGIAHSEPLYVLGVDAARKEVIAGKENELYCSGLTASGFNWLCEPDSFPVSGTCKIRYRHKPVACDVYETAEEKIKVRFNEPQKSVTPGQAVVIYDGDIVLGGGWIERGLDDQG
jgi:tRNA-specific 2-thiouridylase